MIVDTDQDIPFPSKTSSSKPIAVVQTYDVSFLKESKGADKKHWVKIGIAFAGENGRISVTVDSIPLNWNGRLTLFPRTEK